MSIFSVTATKEKALAEKMEALNIREEDIEESFIRSSGKGGQHVNKTSTCVYLKHLPTGLEVKCQQERSQSPNRYRARVLLAGKIEQLIKGRESEEIQRIERYAARKGSGRKEPQGKMLAEKKIVSEKKKLRSRPAENNA
jgi:protein subunit release factor B